MAPPPAFQPGDVVNRWTVVRCVRSTGQGRRYLCRCECGTEREVQGYRLRSGRARSCGECRRDDFRQAISVGKTRHGHSASRVGIKAETPTYRSWRSMKDRCFGVNRPDFANYGARGITVCPEWRDSFEAFLRDMGERPAGTTLDRIDVNGSYEPGNCRWATRAEQAANKRVHARIAELEARLARCTCGC